MLNPISNARSGEPYGFFWSYTESGVHYICATQGGAFVRRLRATLGLSDSDIWDANVQNALITMAQQFAATDPRWVSTVTALQRDLNAQIPSLLSTQFGLYLTYYRPAGKRFDLIGLAPTTVLPVWGVPPAPFDPTTWAGHTPDEMICFVPSVDQPPPLSRADTAAAVLASQTGVRAGRSQAAPPEIVHGVSNEVSGWLLAGVAVVFFGGVWLVYRRTA
jgi:hypothetical protein